MTRWTVLLLLGASGMLHADEFDARLEWDDQRVVSIPVDGLVTSVDAEPGQIVMKGDSLLRFSQSSASFALDKAQAAFDAAQAALREALRERKDAEVLYEQTVLSDVELQAALIKYDQVRAQHAAAKAELDLAKWVMGWTRVSAPYHGRVISSQVLPGQVIAGDVRSQPLMKLASASSMRAVAVVGMEQLGRISIGDGVKLRVDDDSFDARVVSLEHVVSKNAVDRLRLVVRFDTPRPMHRGARAAIITP